MAGRYDFTIEQGATFRRVFTWQIDGEPVDVTGFLARLQVRPTLRSDDLLIDLASPSDQLTVGTDDGTVTMLLSDEDTQELEFDGVLAHYDLELESPEGEVTRLLEGRVALAGEVTREDQAS